MLGLVGLYARAFCPHLSVVCLRQPSPVELCPKIYVVCCLRFFSYWYRALGLLVTEMESGPTAGTVITAAGGESDAVGGVARSSSNRGTLVAASLGGAKRCAILQSCIPCIISVCNTDSMLINT